MTRKLSTELMWRKSTYSGKDGNCVEVARLDGSAVAVRDSKAPHGLKTRVLGACMDSFAFGYRPRPPW